MLNPVLPVILAAGLGSRLIEELGPDLPKGLCDINGKSLVEYQLDILGEFDVPEVLIVVGHLESKYRDFFGEQYKDIKISYVVNQDFATTGSASSFLKSQNHWRTNKQSILMLHADIFFDPQILRDAFLDTHSNLLVVDENYVNATNDEQVVFGDNNLVKRLVKGPADTTELIGESVAINVFSVAFLEQYFPFLEDATSNRQDLNWEQSMEEFLSLFPDLELCYVGIVNRLWVNINYVEDLEYARNDMYPKIYK